MAVTMVYEMVATKAGQSVGRKVEQTDVQKADGTVDL